MKKSPYSHMSTLRFMQPLGLHFAVNVITLIQEV